MPARRIATRSDSSLRDARRVRRSSCGLRVLIPRTGGITSLSRRQARRSTSAQSRNFRSRERQMRTSVSRVLPQVTAIPARLSPGLALTNASSTSSGVTLSAALRLEKFRRDLHGGARLAHGLEIAARRQAGAHPVLVPFVEDQPRRRHQVEHRRHDAAVEPRAPGSGRIPESPSRIAATARAPRTNMAARRCIAAGALGRSPASAQKDGDQDNASR